MTAISHILVVTDCRGKRAFLLDDAVYTLGSALQMGIVVDDPCTDRHHCTLLRESGQGAHDYQYRLIDGNLRQDSHQGLEVNGIRCSNYELTDGDGVTLGRNVTIRYYARSLEEYQLSVGIECPHLHPATKGKFLADPSTGTGSQIGDKAGSMTLLLLEQVELCVVQNPNGGHSEIGVMYEDRCFQIEHFCAGTLSNALERFSPRLRHPRHSGELCFLLQCPAGYQLCVHHRQLNLVPRVRDLMDLSTQIRSSTSLVRDHRWRLRIFRNSFVGSEMVSWLVDHLHLSRKEATLIGQTWLSHGLCHHVLGEHPFLDTPYFYRFCEDGKIEHRVLAGNRSTSDTHGVYCAA